MIKIIFYVQVLAIFITSCSQREIRKPSSLKPQSLVCESESFSIKAELQGYRLQNLTFSIDGKTVLEKRNLSSTKSHDNYQSDNFRASSSYPVYSLGLADRCQYLLALPGGDMRDFSFIGLLKHWGYDCRDGEVELKCNTH